jgi:hypothetical protein
MWQMSRMNAIPAPIGSPVASLISRRLSAFLPQDCPVVPAR